MSSIQKVLIIEDFCEVATWLQTQVVALLPDAKLTHAASLSEAKKAVKQCHFDLALVDLGLPDGNGSQFIELYKLENPHVLCVVTTIFDDAEHLITALRAGADGYLLKDDTEEEFIAQLNGILNGRPPLSASIARCLLNQFHPKQENKVVLTQRETDMLTLTAKGLSVKHSAELLNISYYTAAGYLKEVYKKLQVNSRAEATIKAVSLKLINPE